MGIYRSALLLTVACIGSCNHPADTTQAQADPLKDPIAARKLLHELDVPATSDGILGRIKGNDGVGVRLFLACGWEPGQRIQSKTLVGHAVADGSKSVLAALLEHDPSAVNMATDDTGATPLMLAIESGNLDMVDYLLSKSPDLLETNFIGHCALSYTVKHKLGLDGARLSALRKRLVPVPDQSSDISWLRQHALDAAVLSAGTQGTVDDVRELIAMGGSSDVTNSANWPVVNLAAQRGALDVVAALLQAKAKTDYIDPSGKRLVHHAVRKYGDNKLSALAQNPPVSDLVVIVKLLRAEGMDIYAKDSEGKVFLDSLNEQDRHLVESALQ